MRWRLLLALVLISVIAPAQEREGDNKDDVYPPAGLGDEAGLSPVPTPPITCPCALGGDLGDWVQAECIDQPNYTGSPPRSPAPTCVPPPNSPAYLFLQCDPGGAYPPHNILYTISDPSGGTCDFMYFSCRGTLPCTPVTEYDSGELPVTAEEAAVCGALLTNSGYCE